VALATRPPVLVQRFRRSRSSGRNLPRPVHVRSCRKPPGHPTHRAAWQRIGPGRRERVGRGPGVGGEAIGGGKDAALDAVRRAARNDRTPMPRRIQPSRGMSDPRAGSFPEIERNPAFEGNKRPQGRILSGNREEFSPRRERVARGPDPSRQSRGSSGTRGVERPDRSPHSPAEQAARSSRRRCRSWWPGRRGTLVPRRRVTLAFRTDEWILRAIHTPAFEEIQEDGRIRRWVRIPEAGGRYLRVILLPDGETVHNAFLDRSFPP
jgi:hypothetical protein